jgi:hypothetical protein
MWYPLEMNLHFATRANCTSLPSGDASQAQAPRSVILALALDVKLESTGEFCTGGCEFSANGSGQYLFTGNRAKSKKSNNQCIFNQILAFLAAYQVLQLPMQFEKQNVQFCCPRIYISGPWGIPLRYAPGSAILALS